MTAPKAPPALEVLPSRVSNGPFIQRLRLNVLRGAYEYANSEKQESDRKESEKQNQANILPERGNAGHVKNKI